MLSSLFFLPGTSYISCSFNPYEKTAKKKYGCSEPSNHTLLNLFDTSYKVLSLNSLQPCPQGTPALLMSHSWVLTTAPSPAKLCAHTGSPPHASPLLLLPSPPHSAHTASSSSLDGMEGWPVLTHFLGKNSQIECATHYQHDASRERGLEGGDGAKY